MVGGPEAFAPFVLAYVAEFRHKTLTSADFREFFTNYWKGKGVDTSAVDWEAWYTAPGMPAVANEFDGSLAAAATAVKQKWVAGGDDSSPADIEGWGNGQTLRLLDSLLEDDFAPQLTPALLARMDAAYSFSSSGNAEVRFRWQRLGIKAEMPEIIPQVQNRSPSFSSPFFPAFSRARLLSEWRVHGGRRCVLTESIRLSIRLCNW